MYVTRDNIITIKDNINFKLHNKSVFVVAKNGRRSGKNFHKILLTLPQLRILWLLLCVFYKIHQLVWTLAPQIK